MVEEKKPVKVFKLKHQRKHFQKVKETDDYLKVCIVVMLHCPQYTLEQLREMPFRYVKMIYDRIQAERAEDFLTLNAIVNGPNAKDESKSAYKNTIEALVKLTQK
ncbi:MAG: hypothetical protein IJ122_06420 [Methanobrevibacter sp.]|nr:hypothetical protein [Methanobrevibacter sp.]